MLLARMQPPDSSHSYGRFPTTRHSIIEALRGDDSSARRTGFNILTQAYWRPVYKHLRAKWHQDSESAKDLTQEFFARAFERQYFESFDPDKAKFRTFMRMCLDRFVQNEQKREGRLKRGGEIEFVEFDFATAEREIHLFAALDEDSAETLFEREWVRSIFTMAVTRLKDECDSTGKSIHFELFEHYNLQPEESGEKTSYRELADRYSIKETDVTNYLALARRRFRQHTLDVIRELTANESEFRAEAQSLLGVTFD